MASERQIAANRLNARKSTGPRSGAGRKRASRNAYRHGLTLNITSTVEVAKQLDKLARKIAGNTDDAITLEFDRGGRHIVPKPIDAAATMPSQQPERLAEAIRRVLPQLRKLDRYERRAAAQRERGFSSLLIE